MRNTKTLMGYLAALLLAACSPLQPTATGADEARAEQVAPAQPALDLATASIEFALEIKGDDDPLTQIPDVALDGQGNLLVIDGNNHQIRVFGPGGQSLGTWGSRGEGDGQFQFLVMGAGMPPWSKGGLTVDEEGHVYVADAMNCRVQKLNSEGGFLAKWGECGTDDGQFLEPVGVAVDGKGHVYVTDPARGDVQKFDSEGQFVARWPNMSAQGYGWVVPAVDQEGNIYVPNDHAVEVRKYSGEGELLMTFGKRGRGDGEFIKPVAVAVDRQGNVYVADKDLHCIQKFDHEGNSLARWGSRGNDPSQFRGPAGVVVDADGTIYVAEWGGQRVQKFRQQ
jgi:DNA-binding beta-propeller fold protein YncE